MRFYSLGTINDVCLPRTKKLNLVLTWNFFVFLKSMAEVCVHADGVSTLIKVNM